MADVLKKRKYQVDKESLEKIYFSFIRPKLEYGNCHKDHGARNTVLTN